MGRGGRWEEGGGKERHFLITREAGLSISKYDDYFI